MICATHLKTNGLVDPASLTPGEIHFTWLPENALAQTAFAIRIVQHGKIVFESGKILGSDVRYTPGFVATPAGLWQWELTLYDEADAAGEVALGSFGTVLDTDGWQAVWIDPEPNRQDVENPRKNLLSQFKKLILKQEVGPPRHPASYLKKNFTVDSEQIQEQATRLFVTAHGVYAIWLNGARLENWVLAPGFTQYNALLNVQAYDVASYLHAGENEIVVCLGDGWYRGSMNNERDLNTFGCDVALLCELRAGDCVLMASDETWMAANDGPLGLNDMQLGEHYDANRSLHEAHWHPVRQRDFPFDNLLGSDCPPIMEQERFSPELIHTPNGEWVLDFGQNFAGYVQMDFPANGGEQITLTHGETLDKEGNFTQRNILAPTKPAAYQQVFYTCKQGQNSYRPSTCFFGFRYVRIETTLNVEAKWFTGIAVYSSMEQTASFACGNDKVNRLFANSLWSMKSNFISVMTDCPTRERSGYTGDAQVFCPTGLYLMDSYPVYQHWLESLKQVFQPDGGLKMFAPENQSASFMDSSHGWCDAIVIIPYLMWRRSNNLDFVTQNYASAKKWVDFALARAASGTHRKFKKRLPKELWPYVADQGFTFGEWLEPKEESMFLAAMTYFKRVLFGDPEVATAYLFYSTKLLAEMSAAIGDVESSKKYAEAAQKVRQAYRTAFTSDGKIMGQQRQCLYVRPMALGLLDEREKRDTGNQLAERIVENADHLNTGFLSTAYLCRMLSDHGHSAKAYDLLLQETSPSWLYAVNKGATTIWESWRGIDETGKVTNSFNHYSLGAITGWLLDSVCGVRVENDKITIIPKSDKRLGHAEGLYCSPLGTIVSGWKYVGSDLFFEGDIPCGQTAELTLPDGSVRSLDAGHFSFVLKG